jgi:hypothetical protein
MSHLKIPNQLWPRMAETNTFFYCMDNMQRSILYQMQAHWNQYSIILKICNYVLRDSSLKNSKRTTTSSSKRNCYVNYSLHTYLTGENCFFEQAIIQSFLCLIFPNDTYLPTLHRSVPVPYWGIQTSILTSSHLWQQYSPITWLISCDIKSSIPPPCKINSKHL